MLPEKDMRAMRIMGIDHIVLLVNDMDRMVDFYGTVLGCLVEHRQDAIEGPEGLGIPWRDQVDLHVGVWTPAALGEARAAEVPRIIPDPSPRRNQFPYPPGRGRGMTATQIA